MCGIAGLINDKNIDENYLNKNNKKSVQQRYQLIKIFG